MLHVESFSKSGLTMKGNCYASGVHIRVLQLEGCLCVPSITPEQQDQRHGSIWSLVRTRDVQTGCLLLAQDHLEGLSQVVKGHQGKVRGETCEGHFVLVHIIQLLNSLGVTLSADVCHPVTHRESCCPHCPPLSQRGDPAEWGACSFIAPFTPSTLPRLIKHIPTDYTHRDIHNTATHSHKHSQRGKTHPSDVQQDCPKRGNYSRLELDNGSLLCGNNISQTAKTK